MLPSVEIVPVIPLPDITPVPLAEAEIEPEPFVSEITVPVSPPTASIINVQVPVSSPV